MPPRSAPSSHIVTYINPRNYDIPERTMKSGEALELFYKFKDSQDTKFLNLILGGNMRRIFALCSKPHYQYDNIDPYDLIQEASIGFLTGIRKYDPRKGASVAPYCHFWAEKAIREYIRTTGHTIQIPDNCQRAYKLMMKRYDAARAEYQTEYIAPDALLHDKHPYEVAGAIAILTRNMGEPTSEPSSFNNAPHSRDLQQVLQATAALPEPQRSILRAYYGLSEDDLKKLMRRHGISQEDMERIVAGGVEKIKRAFTHRDAPRSHLPPGPRINIRGEQVTLFERK